MWYIVDVWWDHSDEGTPNDNFMVYANSESEAQKIAKKWGPPVDLTVRKVDPKYAKNAEDAISMFHKKKISVDFVVDKGGRMHRIKNGKIQGQISEARGSDIKKITSLAMGELSTQSSKNILRKANPKKLGKLIDSLYDKADKVIKKRGLKMSQDEIDAEVAVMVALEISTKGSRYLSEASMGNKKEVKENYTRFPTLKKLVQVQYTDPRNKEGGFKIHTEFDGPYVNDRGIIEGTYVMYEDENFPGNFIGVHVSNELSEEDRTPVINVVAMDRDKKLVRDRMAYRRRKSNAAVNELFK